MRELATVVNQQGAQIGVFICLESPTPQMIAAAAAEGYYKSPLGTSHPRLQIRTIAELLDGKGIDYPRGAVAVTFKAAPKAKAAAGQGRLGLE